MYISSQLWQLEYQLFKQLINYSNNFYAGLEFAVETLKSFILAMALIDNCLNVEKAVSLSRLELEFQVGVLK